MKLTAYAIGDHAPKIVPAPQSRAWMDAFTDRHAYRCLPLNIANTHGWQILCPGAVEVTWDGGPNVENLTVRGIGEPWNARPVENFARSNFSRGVCTLHVDFIFRTEPGWNLLATGPFNDPKENASPLTGIIESWWLPYTFTQNWQILRPGTVRFEKDEPYCFIFPVPSPELGVLDCEMEIRNLSDDQAFSAQHDAFRRDRDEFMRRFHAGDPTAHKEAWRKHYFVGRHPDGQKVQGHISKMKVKDPVDLRPT